MSAPTGRVFTRYIVQVMSRNGSVRGIMRILPDEPTLRAEMADRFPGASMYIVSAKQVAEHTDGIGGSIWFPIE